MKLDNISSVVTGGASGLGAAAAIALANSGAKLAILDRNIELAKKTAHEIGALAFECDVTDEMTTKKVISQIREKNGVPRVLVNCAGIAPSSRIVGKQGPMSLEEFENVIRVNLVGSFNMMRLVAAEMITSEVLPDGERGVIISTASVAAYEGQIGQAAYSASKGGVVSMTLPAAREFAQFGIRVNAIAPGLFLTPLLDGMSEEIKQNLSASIPFPKRLGTGNDFAKLVIHIIENSYINGEVIRIDGALRMQAK